MSIPFVVGAEVLAPEPDIKERLVLTKRLHEIKPIRPIVNAAISEMASQLPEQDREKFLNAMMLATDYDAVEKESINNMTGLFTSTELQAMLNYYGSDAAKSAESKMPIYLKAVADSIQKALDQGVLDAALKPKNNPQKTTPETPKK